MEIVHNRHTGRLYWFSHVARGMFEVTSCLEEMLPSIFPFKAVCV